MGLEQSENSNRLPKHKIFKAKYKNELARLRDDFETQAKLYHDLHLTLYYSTEAPALEPQFSSPNHAVCLWQYMGELKSKDAIEEFIEQTEQTRFGLTHSLISAFGIVEGEQTELFRKMATRAGTLIPPKVHQTLMLMVTEKLFQSSSEGKPVIVVNKDPVSIWLNFILVCVATFQPGRLGSQSLSVDPFTASLAVFDHFLVTPKVVRKPHVRINETAQEGRVWKFVGSSPGLFMLGIGFVVGGYQLIFTKEAFTASVCLAVLGWVCIAAAVFRHRFVENKTKQLLISSLVSLAIGALLFGIWKMSPSPQSDSITNVPTGINTVHVPEPPDHNNYELSRVLTEQVGIAWSLDFSPDGKLFATGSSDGRVRVWDTTSWKLKYEVYKHEKGVNKNINSIAFSPDNRLLVSGGSDSTIRIWDMTKGTLLRTIKAHFGPPLLRGSSGVLSLSFSRDGKMLVSSGFDGSILVWRVEEDWQPFQITKQADLIFSAVFSPDSTEIVSSSRSGGIQFWSSDRHSQDIPLRTMRIERHFTSLAFSPNGIFFAAASGDKEIVIWATQSWGEEQVLADHESIVSSISFLTDHQIVSGGYDNKVKTWSIADGSSRKIKDYSGMVTAVSSSSDGNKIAVGAEKVEVFVNP